MLNLELIGTNNAGLNVFQAKSRLTGKLNTMALPVTVAQIEQWKASRRLIQQCFPTLTDQEREFLLTGSTEEEWHSIFGEEEA